MAENSYGHRKMIVWQKLDLIDKMVQSEILPSIPKNCFQLLDQTDRSCSSSVANFIEGYYSGSPKEYIRFLHYSKRSLAELQDWVRRLLHKGFLSDEKYLRFDDLSIKTMFFLNRLINALKHKLSSTPH